jgi:hypothetical protein
MKITAKEVITRFKTIEIPDDEFSEDEFMEMENYEIDEDSRLRDMVFDAVETDGWDETYCHEFTLTKGTAPDVLYYKG